MKTDGMELKINIAHRMFSKKHRKHRKFLFAFLKFANVKLIGEPSNMSVEGFCVEGRRIVFALDKLISGLNHEEAVVLRQI